MNATLDCRFVFASMQFRATPADFFNLVYIALWFFFFVVADKNVQYKFSVINVSQLK
ncbi:hypothetical protein [Undibacterium sp. WLHG33]|uniref:hypothetical protein n=1 Tax=Undibacterium sp. WLHG33 TaxID=3412482 RepID=UPI003C2D01A7